MNIDSRNPATVENSRLDAVNINDGKKSGDAVSVADLAKNDGSGLLTIDTNERGSADDMFV